MSKANYDTTRKPGTHLTQDERNSIQSARDRNLSIRAIAKEVHVSKSAVAAELKRGKCSSKLGGYSAVLGQQRYELNRKRSRRNLLVDECSEFLAEVTWLFKNYGWGIDTCVGYIKANPLIIGKAVKKPYKYMRKVSTQTIYNYIEKGYMAIKNGHLPEKLKRRSTKKVLRKNKRIFGMSIERRAEIINNRGRFGDWEADTVIGKKTKGESCVLTLVERTTRYCIWIKLKEHTAQCVQDAMKTLFDSYGSEVSKVFKSITTDNGLEFSRFAELNSYDIDIYFCHPFCSGEKGTNERYNRELRRFVPKGESFNDYTQDDLNEFARCVNVRPKKDLSYETSEDLYEYLMDEIYAL